MIETLTCCFILFVMLIIGLEIVKSCINQKAIEGPHGNDFKLFGLMRSH